MAKSHQLVAWTGNGRVRMIPSEIRAFINGELDKIYNLADSIRYKTCHEVHDTLEVSSAYEKLGIELLCLGQTEDAFQQLVRAALCCTASRNNWHDTEWGAMLCSPLRGRFFALFCQCRDLVRKHPWLRLDWERSGLERTRDDVTCPERIFSLECYVTEKC